MRQQITHRYEEQNFGLCGRSQGSDDLRELHWDTYITICAIDSQSKFDAWNRPLKAGTLGEPRGMESGGRGEGCSGCGDTCIPVTDSCQYMAKTTTIK